MSPARTRPTSCRTSAFQMLFISPPSCKRTWETPDIAILLYSAFTFMDTPCRVDVPVKMLESFPSSERTSGLVSLACPVLVEVDSNATKRRRTIPRAVCVGIHPPKEGRSNDDPLVLVDKTAVGGVFTDDGLCF